jgi:ABC-type cobalamin/Fe3+-siderophores transport system ATPase subunit
VTTGLRADRVCLRHAGADRDSIRDLSLDVVPGELLVLAGPNGSGKSTLLDGFARRLRARSGRLCFEQRDIHRWRSRSFAQRVASLPQNPACAEGVSVESIVRSGRHAFIPALGSPTARDRDAIERALSDLDLGDLRRRTIETLSGGERRRVFLAMVLAQESEVILLDEPTAALDLRQQWEVLSLLARIHRERGATIVVSLHDLAHACEIAGRVALLHRGRLYAVGRPTECLRADSLRDVYGVDAALEKIDGRYVLPVRGPADAIRSL